MKLATLILLAFSLQLSARGYSQNISLSFREAKLENIFRSIEAQSGYHFIYSDEEIDKASTISIHTQSTSLRKVLELCLAGQPLTYSIDSNHYIVITQKASIYPDTAIIVTGVVTDLNDRPLFGVTVADKRTAKATVTGVNGEFTLYALHPPVNLVISFVGFITQEIKTGDQRHLVIRMVASVANLDEVQVIAYGTVTRRLNTGDVSSVKAETIADQPVSSPLEALEGRVPGLVVTQQTGLPGGAFSVQIRGQNSISSGNDPLYVVDGVPFNSTSLIISGGIINGGSPLDYLNPADIENIAILKDADATAIYGSRAANGAILITTKKGVAGKTKVSLDIYTGAGSITRPMHLMGTKQYLRMRHEAFANDQASPDPNSDYDLVSWDTTRSTDWQKALIGGTAQITDVQGTVSGGNENTRFLLGGGYHGAKTVFPGDSKDQKESIHFNITNISENKKFNCIFSGSYLSDNNKLIQSDLTSTALTLAPDAPPRNDSLGVLNWANGSYNNPYATLLQAYNENTSSLIGNAVVGYNILPGLKLKTSFGFTKTETSEVTPTPVSSFNPAYGVTTGASSFANNSTKSWIVEPQMEYQLKTGKGQFTALIGSTFQETINQNQFIFASGYTSDALLQSIAGASSLTTLSAGYSQYRYSAAFARINYELQKKYLLNITGRRDGSSRFGPERRIANFGAIGASWIFSSEQFIRDNVKAISFGKLRSSYGITGNDQIGDYQYLSNWNSTAYPYQGITGLYPSNLLNPNYSWETNRKFEIGLDAGFLRDRILVTFNYYRNKSSNQLVGYPLPSITGFNSIQSNLPALIQNTGIEIELNTINIKTAHISWSTSFNISFPNNKLVSYPGFLSSNYVNRFVIGQPLNIVKAFHYTGVDPVSGLFTFEDVNNDNQITYPDDLTAYKKVAKSCYGGLLNSIGYKQLRLNFFFQFVKQTGYNYFYGNTIAPGMMGNQPDIVLNRWQKPGDHRVFEQFTQSYASSAYAAYTNLGESDYGISDASFIRLKNISVAYEFPGKFNQRSHLQNLTVYLKGQNLITITKYIGLDPENNGSLSLPPLKILTAGIKITF